MIPSGKLLISTVLLWSTALPDLGSNKVRAIVLLGTEASMDASTTEELAELDDDEELDEDDGLDGVFDGKTEGPGKELGSLGDEAMFLIVIVSGGG